MSAVTTLSGAISLCRTATIDALQALTVGSLAINNSAHQSQDSAQYPLVATLYADFNSLLALLDSHITRIGLSLKPPITTAGVIKYLGEASSDLGRLGSCALTLPPSAGQAIRKEFIWSAQEVIEGIKNMCSGFEKIPNDATTPPDDYLRYIGSVHASLDKIRQTLSRDNASAVEKRWNANSGSIEDALGECKEMLERAEKGGDGGEEGDNEGGDDEWDEIFGETKDSKMSAAEIETVKQVYPLLRLTALLHRKLIKHYRTDKGALSTVELDSQLAISSKLVDAFDDLVVSLEPTQDQDDIKTQTKAVIELVTRLRTTIDLEKMTTDLPQAMDVGSSAVVTNPSPPKDAMKWFTTCFSQIDSTSQKILA